MNQSRLNKILFIFTFIIILFSFSACNNNTQETSPNIDKEQAIVASENEEPTTESDTAPSTAELTAPTREQVLNMRASVTEGMSDEEIERITENIKIANITMENAYFYERLFEHLSDPDDLYWNYIDETGDIQIGWAFETDEYDESLGLSYDEYAEQYGTPVTTYNRFDADNFVTLMEEMRDSLKNDLLKSDFNILIQLMKSAKETHDVDFIKEIYYILHDMDYFLFRYGIDDVGMYVTDDSTISKYYGALNVYQ